MTFVYFFMRRNTGIADFLRILMDTGSQPDPDQVDAGYRYRAYNGSSMGLIRQAIEGHIPYEAFFLKAVFTAVTLWGRLEGGELFRALSDKGATFWLCNWNVVGFLHLFVQPAV